MKLEVKRKSGLPYLFNFEILQELCFPKTFQVLGKPKSTKRDECSGNFLKRPVLVSAKQNIKLEDKELYHLPYIHATFLLSQFHQHLIFLEHFVFK